MYGYESDLINTSYKNLKQKETYFQSLQKYIFLLTWQWTAIWNKYLKNTQNNITYILDMYLDMKTGITSNNIQLIALHNFLLKV